MIKVGYGHVIGELCQRAMAERVIQLKFLDRCVARPNRTVRKHVWWYTSPQQKVHAWYRAPGKSQMREEVEGLHTKLVMAAP